MTKREKDNMNWYKKALRVGDTIIHKNPTRENADRIIRNTPYKEARALLMPNGDLYLWDANALLHQQVINVLNLGDRLKIEHLGMYGALAYPSPIFLGEKGKNYWKDIKPQYEEIVAKEYNLITQ